MYHSKDKKYIFFLTIIITKYYIFWTNFAGSLLDSEDDLFLGTDAQAFSASLPPLLSPGSSDSVSTG